MSVLRVALVLLSVGLCYSGPARGQGAADMIGQTAAVKDIVTGRIEAATRRLKRGDAVYSNETIATNVNSVAQFVLIDKSKLAVGPNSKIVLDKFVYDARKGKGDIVLNVGKGALRFISGISSSSSYTIKTPHASIGVRGTVVDVYVHPNGEAAVALVRGGIRVCGKSGTCRALKKAGSLLHVTRKGLVSAPMRWNPKIMEGVSFSSAFPFISNQRHVLRGFRASESVVKRFIPVPTRLKSRIPDLPKLPRPITPLTDRWILR